MWFQNSLRGALGLTIAVLLAEVTEIEHGFWVVLGAMSVLRTTALTTGSTALRALGGTFVGFVVGAGDHDRWSEPRPGTCGLLLPFVVLIAAYLPEAVSFAAGQAAFTLMVVILFNIIQPIGWSVGLVRIEDIALGCAAGLISGVLLWPRGASAQIRGALADYYRRSADALEAATDRLTHPTPAARTLDEVMSNARAAGLPAGRRLPRVPVRTRHQVGADRRADRRLQRRQPGPAGRRGHRAGCCTRPAVDADAAARARPPNAAPDDAAARVRPRTSATQ